VSTALAVSDLHVHLGESHVLQGISFDVPSGGVTALLGRNGVGKTTTLRALMGLVPPTRGAIALAGEDVTRLATHAVVRRGVGYVPEDRDVFAGLTVEENLRLAERSREPRYDLVHELFPELRERAGQRAGTLSGGQQQMVAIARALLNENRLLLVDEPTKGLAPAIIQNMITVFRELKQTEVSILLVEQNFHMAKSVGDTVAVMDDGKIVHTGRMAALAEDEALQQRLLGLSLAAHQ